MAIVSAPSSAPPASPPVSKPAASRLMSLDALRGFDMLWILGADEIGYALYRLRAGPVVDWVGKEFHHSKWEGFTLYDLIFPQFVFIIGVALTFSLGKLLADGRGPALRRVFRRTVILYVLGLLYYGGLSTPFSQIRYVGVLQRLAFCYLFASLAYIYLRPRGITVLCAGLLIGYWALMRFVPVPHFGADDFAEHHNLANWIDRQWLPGRKLNGDYDPEGILSTIPSIATCLIGVLAGFWLRHPERSERRKAAGLAIAAVVLTAAGWTWGLEFPVIKLIWTSSYALVAAGYSLGLLAIFYVVMDVWQVRTWAMPFVWIGVNPLTIYLIGNAVDFNKLSALFVGGPVEAMFNRWHMYLGFLVLALTSIVISILICRFLYKKRVFIRI